MNTDADEFLSVLSTVSFLENSEQDFLLEDESIDGNGRDISPDHITTNQGGGDTIVGNRERGHVFGDQLVNGDGAERPFSDLDSSVSLENVENHNDSLEFQSARSNENESVDNFQSPSKTAGNISVNSDLSTLNGDKTSYCNASDYRDDFSDNEDAQTQVSKSSVTSKFQIKDKGVPLSAKSSISSKHVQAQCKSYIHKGTHRLEYNSVTRITQPVVIKHKTIMKIKTEETIQLTPNSKRNLSVPTQLKAEALWHDNVLRLIVRGPPNKLPPLQTANFKDTGSADLPIDLELTFIPTHARASTRPPKAVPRTTTAPTSTYKRRKPFVSKPKAKQPDLLFDSQVDRNIIANRAVGTGFITQITPQNLKQVNLPRVQQGSTNMTSNSFHYGGTTGSASTKPYNGNVKTYAKYSRSEFL